jgi:hypothetical protein
MKLKFQLPIHGGFKGVRVLEGQSLYFDDHFREQNSKI